jgi:Flp pilus assembly pilin Flp
MPKAAALLRLFGTSARSFRRDERGGVAVEYGVLMVMILAAILGIGSLSGVANKQSATFNQISDVMD